MAGQVPAQHAHSNQLNQSSGGQAGAGQANRRVYSLAERRNEMKTLKHAAARREKQDKQGTLNVPHLGINFKKDSLALNGRTTPRIREDGSGSPAHEAQRRR